MDGMLHVLPCVFFARLMSAMSPLSILMSLSRLATLSLSSVMSLFICFFSASSIVAVMDMCVSHLIWHLNKIFAVSNTRGSFVFAQHVVLSRMQRHPLLARPRELLGSAVEQVRRRQQRDTIPWRPLRFTQARFR